MLKHKSKEGRLVGATKVQPMAALLLDLRSSFLVRRQHWSDVCDKWAYQQKMNATALANWLPRIRVV